MTRGEHPAGVSTFWLMGKMVWLSADRSSWWGVQAHGSMKSYQQGEVRLAVRQSSKTKTSNKAGLQAQKN